MSSTYERVRWRAFTLLSVAKAGDRLSAAIDIMLATLIVLNVIAAILQTVESLYGVWEEWFDGFELVSVLVFSGEYVLRVWSCTADERYRGRLLGRLRFAVTPMLLIGKPGTSKRS